MSHLPNVKPGTRIKFLGADADGFLDMIADQNEDVWRSSPTGTRPLFEYDHPIFNPESYVGRTGKVLNVEKAPWSDEAAPEEQITTFYIDHPEYGQVRMVCLRYAKDDLMDSPMQLEVLSDGE